MAQIGKWRASKVHMRNESSQNKISKAFDLWSYGKHTENREGNTSGKN